MANIYLNELDAYIEDVLIPQYTRGKQRAPNQEYFRLKHHIQCAREAGDQKRVRELELKRRTIPSGNVNDPNFRRLQYIRYADDFILSFIGPKSEAEAIKMVIGTFLKEHLHLELSASKTLITHARNMRDSWDMTSTSTMQTTKSHHKQVHSPKPEVSTGVSDLAFHMEKSMN